MSDLINAADAIRASIKHFKALTEYADALEKVGQLDQQASEIFARIDILKTEEEREKLKAGKVLAEAKETAQVIVTKASVQAESLAAEAKEEAAKVRATARRTAEKLEAEALAAREARNQAASQRLNELQLQLNELQTLANTAVAVRAEAERGLSDIRAKTEQLKAQYANIFNS